ncbi:sigma-70 family RNA polymerase sigma factor [Saccharopolyspora cebuensis]|uniref:Sigma-70 family RNA polymerase sigma factor n=1 Tax=Saccharopolyspora cebuensis TaxID=418759 RepID=A0ABV4CN05_9PSEU
MRSFPGTPPGRPDRALPASPARHAQLASALAALARGDDRGAVRLYDLLWDEVLDAAGQVVGDPAQAEEVAQEVFVEVWLTADRYREERGSVRTWVLTVARRRSVDRVRSVRAAARRELRYGALHPGRPFDDVVESVLDAAERAELRRRVAALSDLQREALLLTYGRGRTTAQAAALLGIPRATFKTRVRGALHALRRDLLEPPP